jgi:ribosomal protein L7/L12
MGKTGPIGIMSNRLKTVLAGILLGTGLILGGLGLLAAIVPDNSPANRVGGMGLMLIGGGLPIALGSWLIRSQRSSQDQQSQDRLRTVFFRALQEGGGELTVLQFSIAAQLDGAAAKAYLDDQALKFNATFKVSDQGRVSYCFDEPQGPPGLAPGAAGYDVILEYFPPRQRRAVQRQVNALTGIADRDLRALIKRAKSRPVVVAQNLDRASAEQMRQTLEAAGATILVVLR